MYKEFIPKVPLQYSLLQASNAHRKRYPHFSMGQEPRWREKRFETMGPGPGNYNINKFNSLENGS